LFLLVKFDDFDSEKGKKRKHSLAMMSIFNLPAGRQANFRIKSANFNAKYKI
jgi:hypothetical protein